MVEASHAIEQIKGLFPEQELSSENLQAIGLSFSGWLEENIDAIGTSASVVKESKIGPKITQANLIPGNTCLAIDTGGTGPKASLYKVNERGELELIKKEDGTFFQFTGTFEGKVKWNVEEYWGEVVRQIKDEFGDEGRDIINNIDAISYLFSFPGDCDREENGNRIEVTVEDDNLPKGWKITGLKDGGGVGVQLLSSINSSGFKIKSNVAIVVENDTTALVKDQIGSVCATGFNNAFLYKLLGIINTECGNFDPKGMPRNQLLAKYDKRTGSEGIRMAEKIIAGQGVAGQFEEFVKEAYIEGILPREIIDRLAWQDKDIDLNKFMSYLLGDTGVEYSEIELTLTGKQREVLAYGAQEIINASADLYAAIIYGLTKVSNIVDVEEKNIFNIPVEGDLFWKTPGYKDRVVDRLKRLSLNIDFTGDGNRIGMEGGARHALGLNAITSEV